jgi:hypothetical protein
MTTMYTTTYTDVYSGNTVGPAFPQYTAFSLSSSIELSWATDFQNLNMLVSVNMDITPTAGGFTVKMPDATKYGSGFACTINNPGAFDFQLLDNAGALIIAIPAGTAKVIWLISNATVAGTWRTFPNPSGGAAVTSVNAFSGSDNLIITGVPIINTGTIDFQLAKDLLALSTFGASGFGIPVRTADDTWTLRGISGTTNQVSVVNPLGIAGNMTISLAPTITGLTSIAVGQLSLSGNTIASANVDGPVIINPNGVGVIQLAKATEILDGNSLKFYTIGNGYHFSIRAGAALVNLDLLWPTTTPTTGQVLSYGVGGQLTWASIATLPGISTEDALARYSNSAGALQDSPIIVTDAGNVTGLLSCAIGSIVVGSGTLFPAQTIATSVTDGYLIFEPNGAGVAYFLSDVWIKPNLLGQNSLKLFNLAGNKYAGFKASPGMALDALWTLPPAGSTAGYFVTDASNVMSLRPLPTPLVTVVDIVPKFTDVVGTLGASLLSIDGAGVATGLTSLAIGSTTITSALINTTGAFVLSATGNTTISNTGILTLGGAANTSIFIGGNVANTVLIGGAANTGINLITGTEFTVSAATFIDIGAGALLTLSATAGIELKNDTTLSPSKSFKFRNPLDTFETSLKGGAVASSISFTLPTSAILGYVKSDASGILSITADSTASTSPTTGAITVTGGIGIGAKAWIAGNTIIGPVTGTAPIQEHRLTLRGIASDTLLSPTWAAYTSSDAYPLFQNLNFTHDSVHLNFDSYFDGGWKSSHVGSNFQISKASSQLTFAAATGHAAGAAVTWVTGGYIDTAGLLQWQKSITIGTTSVAGGVKVLAIGNATTTPTSTPSSGGVLYVTGGALRYRGSAGTDVQIAAA